MFLEKNTGHGVVSCACTTPEYTMEGAGQPKRLWQGFPASIVGRFERGERPEDCKTAF